MNNWDSLFLYPILIIIIIAAYVLTLRKKGMKSFLQWVFVIQHFFFWLALSCSLSINYNFIIFDFSKNIYSISILFAVSTLFYAAVFFIPGSWITAIVRSRKLWFWISYGLMFTGIALIVIFPQNWTTMIICTIAFGFGISTNSLWFLSFNETYLFRSNPFLTMSMNLPIVIISNMTGANFLMFIKDFHHSMLVLHYIVFGFIAFCLLISFIFCFFMLELKQNIGAFKPNVLNKISKFSWWKVIVILLLITVVGILRELSQGDFLNFILAQKTWEQSSNEDVVIRYLHLVQELWWIPQIVGGVFLYHFFVKKVGIKWSLIVASILWSIYFVIVSVISVPEVLLVLQLLNGFAISILFGILFALAIMWNYRIANRPITGCFSALNAFVGFIVQFLIRLFANKHIGIFNGIDLNWNLPYVNDLTILTKLKNVILYLYIGCAIVSLLLGIITYFLAKFISGEYYNPKMVKTEIIKLMELILPEKIDHKVALMKYLTIKKEVT